MSGSGSKKSAVIAVTVIVAILAGIIIIFEKGLFKQKEPERGLPRGPVVKGVDPELAIKGCLFDLGLTRENVEFEGHDIIIRLKDDIPGESIKESFNQLNKIGKVEFRDKDSIVVVIDGHTWKIRIFGPGMAKPEVPLPVGKKAEIAIIIDDMGQSVSTAKRLANIDDGLTFSILPYNRQAKDVALFFHAKGREVLMHLPLEGSAGKDPGPGAIFSDMSEKEVLSKLKINLSGVPYAVGVNNHMGSVITRDKAKMKVIIEELKKRRLFFVDSLTTMGSVSSEVASEMGEPYAKRDVFLDNELNPAYIAKQLDSLRKIALRNGSAIAICHPHDETIASLESEIPKLKAQGIDIVPVSELVKRKRQPR